MLTYLVSWLVYGVSVLLALCLYHTSLARFLPQAWRPVLLVIAACVMLTPWPIDNQSWLPAPAIVATVFNLMSGLVLEAVKSLLPIFLLITIACMVMWFKHRHQENN